MERAQKYTLRLARKMRRERLTFQAVTGQRSIAELTALLNPDRGAEARAARRAKAEALKAECREIARKIGPGVKKEALVAMIREHFKQRDKPVPSASTVYASLKINSGTDSHGA